MKTTFYERTPDAEPEMVSIREAKKLLKENGGRAWTEHWVGSNYIGSKAVVAEGTNDTNKRYGTR